jgi:hypothetical protein
MPASKEAAVELVQILWGATMLFVTLRTSLNVTFNLSIRCQLFKTRRSQTMSKLDNQTLKECLIIQLKKVSDCEVSASRFGLLLFNFCFAKIELGGA